MNKHKLKLAIPTLVALLVSHLPQVIPTAAAANTTQFQQAFVRLDRMKTSEWTGFVVCATPDTDTFNGTPQNGNEASVTIVIPQMLNPTDFVLDTTAPITSHWITDSTNIPATIPDWTDPTSPAGLTVTPWPGASTATPVVQSVSNVVPKTITFNSGALTVGNHYCFHVQGSSANHTLQNGTDATTGYKMSGGTIFTSNNLVPASGVAVNQTNYSLALYGDDTITVTAVVPPSFQFILGANVDTFPTNLDPTPAGSGGVVNSTSGVQVNVITNAKGGWIGWIKSQYMGLHSATANYTMPSDCLSVPGVCTPTPTGTVNGTPSALTAGTEGYVIAATIPTLPTNGDSPGGCTINIDPEYDGSTAGSGGTPSTTFQPFVACTGPAPATADDDKVVLKELATIRGGTPAGTDYTDTLTVVGAGNF